MKIPRIYNDKAPYGAHNPMNFFTLNSRSLWVLALLGFAVGGVMLLFGGYRDGRVTTQVASGCDTSFPLDQFRVCYFDSTNPDSGPFIVQELEPALPSPVGSATAFYHDWKSGAVASTGQLDTVSGVWRGRINFQQGAYVFHTYTDDGVRLYVDGALVIDKWIDQGPTRWDSPATSLSAGTHDIMFKWYENGGGAVADLWWTGPGIAIPPADFAYIDASGKLLLNGVPFKHIGVNAACLAHYGAGGPGTGGCLEYASLGDQNTQLQAAKDMGVKVVRIFAGLNLLDNEAASTRVVNLVNKAYGTYGIRALIAFADFYSNEFHPQGDDGYYQTDTNGFTVLNHAFFDGGFRNNYLPWAQTLVAKLKDNPGVFAWELGNELKDITFSNSNPATFVYFADSAAAAIRAIDTKHLITSGLISTANAGLNAEQARQLYNGIEVVNVHNYAQSNDVDNDMWLANEQKKPMIVGEAGFPASLGDRGPSVQADLDDWFTARGAQAYYQWGFMATANDIGDGDANFGMDKVFHADWNSLFAVYSAFAASLVGSGDTTPPSVALTAPVSGATVSGNVTVSADATDNTGVTSVDFYRDGGVFLGSDTAAPYSILWNTTTVSNGSHTLFAIAADAAGNTATSATITVTVANPVADTTPPTVSITSPLNGSTVTRNATVTIAASASDNVGVAKVEFLVNSSIKCTDAVAPYSCPWKVPSRRNTTYTIQAKAYDAAGNIGTHTITVTAK